MSDGSYVILTGVAAASLTGSPGSFITSPPASAMPAQTLKAQPAATPAVDTGAKPAAPPHAWSVDGEARAELLWLHHDAPAASPSLSLGLPEAPAGQGDWFIA